MWEKDQETERKQADDEWQEKTRVRESFFTRHRDIESEVGIIGRVKEIWR